jgi:hypothetical protein
MTRVRVRSIKRHRSKGRWYVYHRKTGTRIDAEFGTAAFFNELATLERRVKRDAALPGTLGGLLATYRASRAYLDLASSTRAGYLRMMNLLMPIHDMPLAELMPQFVGFT